MRKIKTITTCVKVSSIITFDENSSDEVKTVFNFFELNPVGNKITDKSINIVDVQDITGDYRAHYRVKNYLEIEKL